MKRYLQLLLLFFIPFTISAQPLPQPDAAEILHSIKKLKVLGSALYIAAHPDDENTRLIAWLANEKMVRTGYLSMTRGDGGQNLIGPEIREKLGIIRTQELLAARRIDKGVQFFTRANDFGYSKSPEETFNVWDDQKILADVVWVIRKFRPDIIITRFPVSGEGGHGHHTGSAILAQKAFDMAADPKAFPEQLQLVDVWQPKRLFLNTGRWWNPDITGNEPGVLTVDVGTYNPLLGTSYSEMAAVSRSQHKSQGFGVTGSRGEAMEYLEHRKGEEAQNELFEGVVTTWERIGASEIEKDLDHIIKAYNPSNPSQSLQSLLRLRKSVTMVKDKFWKDVKLDHLDQVIKDISGFYIEAVASEPYHVPGELSNITLEVTNRSEFPLQVTSITWPNGSSQNENILLSQNKEVKKSHSFKLPADTPYSTPYWLRERPDKGSYNVESQQLIGKPENDPSMAVKIHVKLEDQELVYNVPVYFKWNSPVEGEMRRMAAVVPPVALDFGNEIYLFPDDHPKEVKVTVKNFAERIKGTVRLELSKGWTAEPREVAISAKQKLSEQDVIFTVTPPKGQSSLLLKAVFSYGDQKTSAEVDEIIYSHIPPQVLITPADAELVKLDVKIAGRNIGYIEGAGDEIPSTLTELGFNVTYLSEEDVKGDLSRYEAIVLGIRALNVNDRIGYMMDNLLNYAREGGVLVTQYNTSFRLQTENFAPYPLTLSRDRVTVEESPVEILATNHPVLNYPNKISQNDFQNWVQERGLYFPSQWSQEYVPIFAMADPGQQKTSGSLLIAPYGKGYYVYSGISWFRQLPAGVPGAIRIFVNILSLGNREDAK